METYNTKICQITIVADFTDPDNFKLLFILNKTQKIQRPGCKYSIKMHKHSYKYKWYPSATITMDSTVTIERDETSSYTEAIFDNN